MNPILRMLMSSTWAKGVGERFGGSQTSDLKSLTDALASYKQASAAGDQFSDKNGTNPSQPQAQDQSPMDRIKAAFDSLKDMHKGPNQTDANTAALASPQPSPFDNAQWPYGPQGSPSNAQDSASPLDTAQWPSGPAGAPSSVPMPQPRPADAPQSSPMMSLFQRSAAMQQDPNGGGYIDPEAAAKANAQPGIFHSLFG